MSHPKLLLAMATMPVIMALSLVGHAEGVVGRAEVPVEYHYDLNTEVKALLVDKSSPGECFSNEKPPSVQKKQTFVIDPTPKPKLPIKWMRVVCDADVTPRFLYWLEVRLSHLGILDTQDIFTEGVRVKLDKRMYKAIQNFQVSQGLATGGLSYESVNTLSELDIPDVDKFRLPTK
ncbi:hypothetical protein N9W89_14005 [Hellea sp.]|nr:hypothetical protein [Hellea sp.]